MDLGLRGLWSARQDRETSRRDPLPFARRTQVGWPRGKLTVKGRLLGRSCRTCGSGDLGTSPAKLKVGGRDPDLLGGQGAGGGVPQQRIPEDPCRDGQLPDGRSPIFKSGSCLGTLFSAERDTGRSPKSSMGRLRRRGPRLDRDVSSFSLADGPGPVLTRRRRPCHTRGGRGSGPLPGRECEEGPLPHRCGLGGICWRSPLFSRPVLREVIGVKSSPKARRGSLGRPLGPLRRGSQNARRETEGRRRPRASEVGEGEGGLDGLGAARDPFRPETPDPFSSPNPTGLGWRWSRAGRPFGVFQFRAPPQPPYPRSLSESPRGEGGSPEA